MKSKEHDGQTNRYYRYGQSLGVETIYIYLKPLQNAIFKAHIYFCLFQPADKEKLGTGPLLIWLVARVSQEAERRGSPLLGQKRILIKKLLNLDIIIITDRA